MTYVKDGEVGWISVVKRRKKSSRRVRVVGI